MLNLNNLIFKQLSEILQDNILDYSYDLGYFFKLEKGKNSINILYLADETYSLVVEINGNIEYLSGLLGVQVMYLLDILRDKLKNHSFSIALEEVLKQYDNKIKKVIREANNNENSTN